MYNNESLLADVERMLKQRKEADEKKQKELDGCIMAIQEYFIAKQNKEIKQDTK